MKAAIISLLATAVFSAPITQTGSKGIAQTTGINGQQQQQFPGSMGASSLPFGSQMTSQMNPGMTSQQQFPGLSGMNTQMYPGMSSQQQFPGMNGQMFPGMQTGFPSSIGMGAMPNFPGSMTAFPGSMSPNFLMGSTGMNGMTFPMTGYPQMNGMGSPFQTSPNMPYQQGMTGNNFNYPMTSGMGMQQFPGNQMMGGFPGSSQQFSGMGNNFGMNSGFGYPQRK